MRLGLLVIALGGCAIGCAIGCSGPAAVGPAWPRATVREVDGGESLAPRPAARAIAAIVKPDDGDRAADRAAADTPAAAPAASSSGSTAGKPAAAAPAAPPDESDTIDDIVIEIEDQLDD